MLTGKTQKVYQKYRKIKDELELTIIAEYPRGSSITFKRGRGRIDAYIRSHSGTRILIENMATAKAYWLDILCVGDSIKLVKKHVGCKGCYKCKDII